jgi:hypothetical protein
VLLSAGVLMISCLQYVKCVLIDLHISPRQYLGDSHGFSCSLEHKQPESWPFLADQNNANGQYFDNDYQGHAQGCRINFTQVA